jgi:MFS family permease
MNDKQARWLALYVLCLGDLMIVLDTNIVNVALPSIQADLGFSQTALAWVVNAYMLTFGGFLLLSGRLGDLFGNKRVFLGGVVSFTAASIACGIAPSPLLLVLGRAVQGLGGAAVSAVALALIMGLFTDPAERAKAMCFFGFVMSGGGAVGVLAGVSSPVCSTGTGSFWSTSQSASASGSRPAACCPPTRSVTVASASTYPAPGWSRSL